MSPSKRLLLAFTGLPVGLSTIELVNHLIAASAESQ